MIKEQYYVYLSEIPDWVNQGRMHAPASAKRYSNGMPKKKNNNKCRSSYCVIGSGESVENWFQQWTLGGRITETEIARFQL